MNLKRFDIWHGKGKIRKSEKFIGYFGYKIQPEKKKQ
jgi:hypothetical protein